MRFRNNPNKIQVLNVCKLTDKVLKQMIKVYFLHDADRRHGTRVTGREMVLRRRSRTSRTEKSLLRPLAATAAHAMNGFSRRSRERRFAEERKKIRMKINIPARTSSTLILRLLSQCNRCPTMHRHLPARIDLLISRYRIRFLRHCSIHRPLSPSAFSFSSREHR